jgi:Domain of unknown function (DUF1844)
MGEVHKTDSVKAGEMAQRFIQFVIMQSQQILFVLGAPTAEGESIPPNLEAGHILIDQLEMIQEKTRGNLSPQESGLLEDALTRVRFAYVQASSDAPADAASRPSQAPTETPAPKQASPPATEPSPVSKDDDESEGKKKFSKTYS